MGNNYAIEIGEGRVWSFVASANATSGVLLRFDLGKVRPTTAASQHVAGVSLIPASAGQVISVMMEGIANVLITGASVVGADLLGSAAAGHAQERAWSGLNERRYDAAVALDTIANGARGRVKLLW
jgi:hypothetical protein